MLKIKGHNMTFDECLEKLKSESAEAREFLERAEILAKLYNEYGVEIKEGTGRIMRDGKDIDIVKEIKDAFPRPIMNDACEYCPNNPNNGGSGICHCILGTPVVY